MTIEPNSNELNKFAEWIDSVIQVDYPAQQNVNLNYKLDLLERTIEILRIERKSIRNSLPLEEHVLAEFFMDSGGPRFSTPANTPLFRNNSGTHPIQLQPKLLLFLLLYHNRKYSVLQIIEHFIKKIWDELQTVDFKKTETGVFRCYTNTRFAAKTLRDYGLLKFTRKEAYKTWVLSLPGFLVASRVLDYQNGWTIPKQHKVGNFDLHQDIWDAWSQMNSIEAYVQRLVSICEPNADIFDTFRDVFNKSYELLRQYWKVLRNPNMTIAERRQASAHWIKKLDDMPDSEDFYVELSKSINLDAILSETSNE